jgi:AhpD family alkylhydroperoxidase
MTKTFVKPVGVRNRSRAAAPGVKKTVDKKSGWRVEKRTLTSQNLLRTVANCAISLPVIVRSIFRPKTSRALLEKVMLGVTAINDCRHCAWGHSHWAISQGVPIEEVNQLLRNVDVSITVRNAGEAAAILFGRHYAEHLDRIDPESLRSLRKHFSPDQVREIVAHVHFITFTNLGGNTVDAVLERIRAKGRPISLVEGVAGVALAPILFVLVALVKLQMVVGTDQRVSKRFRSPRAISPARTRTRRT